MDSFQWRNKVIELKKQKTGEQTTVVLEITYKKKWGGVGNIMKLLSLLDNQVDIETYDIISAIWEDMEAEA